MGFAEWLNIILGAIAVVSALGGLVAFFSASRGKSIIELYKEEGSIKDQKITRLEKDAAACAESSKGKDETIAKLEQHNAYLQDLAKQSPELKKLIMTVENNSKLIGRLLEGAKK